MGRLRTPFFLFPLALALSFPAAIDAGHHTPYLLEIMKIAPLTEWKFPVADHSLSLKYSFLPKGTNAKLGVSNVDVAVIGDSFAHPLVGVFSALASNRKLKVVLATSPSCAAFFDKIALDVTTKFDNSKKDLLCKTYARPAAKSLVQKTKAKVVVLSGNWVGTHQIWRAAQDPEHGTSLQETIKILRGLGSKVIVVGMVPGSHHDVAACIAEKGAKQCKEKTPIENLQSRLHTDKSRRLQTGRNRLRDVVRRIMKEEVANDPNDVAYVDAYDAFCPNKKECMNIKNDKAIYYDDHHLSASGSLVLKPAFEKALRKLGVA